MGIQYSFKVHRVGDQNNERDAIKHKSLLDINQIILSPLCWWWNYLNYVEILFINNNLWFAFSLNHELVTH